MPRPPSAVLLAIESASSPLPPPASFLSSFSRLQQDVGAVTVAAGEADCANGDGWLEINSLARKLARKERLAAIHDIACTRTIYVYNESQF